MRVLIGCEFSGVVREAFRARGHEAWSCDLLPAADGSPYHLQMDLNFVLHYPLRVLGAHPPWMHQGAAAWDLMIAHPPCTYLTISAAWAYGDGPYHQRVRPETLVGAARRAAREDAVEFVQRLAECAIPRVAIENPIGHLSRAWRPPDQILHPYQYGHDASKATCLWLKGLPVLQPTEAISPRLVNGRPRWGNQTDSGQNRLGPSVDRWARRSQTYQGIADAMAVQWG